jgi:hypothetical protein
MVVASNGMATSYSFYFKIGCRNSATVYWQGGVGDKDILHVERAKASVANPNRLFSRVSLQHSIRNQAMYFSYRNNFW